MGPETFFFGIVGILFASLVVLIISDQGRGKTAE